MVPSIYQLPPGVILPPDIWKTLIKLYKGTIALLAPFFMLLGLERFAYPIYEVYENFCHQRVERSLFIGGDRWFYTLLELDQVGLVELTGNGNPLYHDYFGHDYVGDENLGYKVALCVRDIGMYIGAIVWGWIYLYRYTDKTDWKPKRRYYLWLMLPMIIDGTFQILSQVMGWNDFIPDIYYTSLIKRVITGCLFGIGFITFIHFRLLDNFINKDDGTESKGTDN